jgi:hypothetical protein
MKKHVTIGAERPLFIGTYLAIRHPDAFSSLPIIYDEMGSKNGSNGVAARSQKITLGDMRSSGPPGS